MTKDRPEINHFLKIYFLTSVLHVVIFSNPPPPFQKTNGLVVTNSCTKEAKEEEKQKGLIGTLFFTDTITGGNIIFY